MSRMKSRPPSVVTASTALMPALLRRSQPLCGGSQARRQPSRRFDKLNETARRHHKPSPAVREREGPSPQGWEGEGHAAETPSPGSPCGLAILSRNAGEGLNRDQLPRFFLQPPAEQFAGFGDRQGGADLDPIGHLVARGPGTAVRAEHFAIDLRTRRRYDKGDDRLAALAGGGPDD